VLRLTVLLVLTALVCFADPADCVPGTLIDYINFGSDGCRLGGRVLSDFFLDPLTAGSTEIEPDVVEVTPGVNGTSASLRFTYSSATAAATVLESFFQMTVKPNPGNLELVELRLLGATATGDAVVLGIVDLCNGFAFGTCFDSTPVSLIADVTSLDDSPTAAALFQPTFRLDPLLDPGAPIQYDLLLDVVLDPGLFGTASLDSVQLTFTAVPEPSTIAILGTQLCCIFVLCRRRKR
jgi:hypothetical protein